MENQETEIYEERLELALGRLQELQTQTVFGNELDTFFQKEAAFLVLLNDYRKDMQKGVWTLSLEACQKYNRDLYADILEENYAHSFGNPSYAQACFGVKLGPLLCVLYAELRGAIFPAAGGELEPLLIRMELFLEVYAGFVQAKEEEGTLPDAESIRRILYWYVFDYAELAARKSVGQMVSTEENTCTPLFMQADLTDERYLYAYGEYVTENQIRMAGYLNSLPEETVRTMADTYTEGYRMGFELAGKDLSKKKTVEIRYALGFERMMKYSVENFEKMGLATTVRRTPVGLLEGGGLFTLGPAGARANRQYEFDHKDDKACIYDKALVQRRLEVYKTVFEHYKEEAAGHAGPAVLETFGEKDFEPQMKKEALQLKGAQQKLYVEHRMSQGEIYRQYIREEERSFTIIAFPVPDIGEHFEEIFADIIRINTLDYMKYRNIQQKLIDALDLGETAQIKGMNGNETDLTVALQTLRDPEKETKFENCVADVNIPVGEVFTSPVLKGTNGLLHVGRVFLEGLEYKDLKLWFTDGMITGYSCSNFETEEENRKFIRENILFHRESLPMGEFAIGTNTLAFVCARKWGIESKLPILIAEKTGPHFAVGDTCYSHAEDIRVYNPDGKEIIARDNEKSILRKTDGKEAYFECHTDITIPYDELGYIHAVTGSGERIPLIENGRFVLPGTEELNEAFVE